jgi:hypothetical protein
VIPDGVNPISRGFDGPGRIRTTDQRIMRPSGTGDNR